MRDLRPNAMNQNQQDSSVPFTVVSSHAYVHNNLLITEIGKNSTIEDDVDGHYESNKSKKNYPWQRVKWMDDMVKLMITALSYLGEDSGFAVLQKRGKWKSVSKVMDERGFHVSPQQCEDKFNDLNKRYKKLNEMLGRGICCEVVENSTLLRKIDYLNEKEKDKVRKIISSKHLFYEEMCSYHNGNRLHLPHDPALQRSLHLTLRNHDDHDDDHEHDHEHGKHQNENLHDEDKDVEGSYGDDYEEHHFSRRGIHHGVLGGPKKRLRQRHNHEDVGHTNSLGCNKGYVPHLPLFRTDVNQGKAASLQKQWIESKSLYLGEQKLQIQAELMELERQRFKWERFSKMNEQKLEKMRVENERMKFENERMTLELKQVELEI